MKKAQIESIGLVIIVILVILGLIFFLIFSTRPETDKNLGTLLQAKANNLRNTMLKTTLCTNSDIKEEIISCIEKDSPICLDHCSDINSRLSTIADNTLDPKDGYLLSITHNNQSFINLERYNYKNCFSASTSNLKQDIDFNIKLCRQ